MIPYNIFITVHESSQVRDSPNFGYNFKTNGLSILSPITCTVTEELNGSYYCEIEHPIDTNGKWRNLNENNIISVPIRARAGEERQLFRIAVREVRDTVKGKRIYVLAHHIFYDLRGRIVLDPNFNAKTATEGIMQITNSVFTRNGEIGLTWYPYTYSSDISGEAAYAWSNPKTLVDLLLSDDHSVANIYGGEIFRDNFRYSINERKEGSIDHSAPIRFGVDMLEVTERTDWSQYCNYARAFIDDGNWNDVSFDSFGSAPGDIVKAQQFHYQNPTMEQLANDMYTFFETTSKPITTFSVNYRSIANNPKYIDFYATKNYEVGDTVPIINERVGINTIQKMVRRVFNVLTQSTETAEFDSIAASITRKQRLGNTAFTSGEDVEYILATRVGKKYGTDQGEVFNDTLTNTAYGKYSTARGSGCDSGGDYSYSGGLNSSTYGKASVAIGEECFTSQDFSFAFGYKANAPAWSHTYAIGEDVVVMRKHTAVLGKGLFAANSAYETGGLIIGVYNANGDAVFGIGNGTGTGERSDLFYITREGNVHIFGDIYVNNVKIT